MTPTRKVLVTAAKGLLLIAVLAVGIVAFGKFSFGANTPWSGILDPSRAIDWSTAGFTIPNYTANCVTQPTLLSGSSNAAANTSAIQNALNSCDATHNVVNLPAGTWYVASIMYGAQGHQVVRGAGPNSTTIIPTTGVGCASGQATGVCLRSGSGGYNGGAEVQPPSGAQQCLWTAGYSQGSTNLTLSSCPGGAPPVNGMVFLDQANDTSDTNGVYICDVNINNCGYEGSSGGNNNGRFINGGDHSEQEVTKVTGVTSLGGGSYSVTISPGVSFTNIRSSQAPGAWWQSMVQNDGLEGLTIDGGPMSSGAPTDHGNIGMDHCYQCWVKDVRSLNAGRYHVSLFETFQDVIRDSYFFGSASTYSESYSVEFSTASQALVENNIFQHVTTPTMFGNGSGNVVDYNFAIFDAYDCGGGCSSYVQQSYESHNAANNFNLFEGNDFLGIAADDAWGTSAQNTYFRNMLYGWQSGKSNNTIPILLRDNNRAYNIIGNVLGEPGYHTGYQTYPTSASTISGGPESVSIYSIGLAGQDECSDGAVTNCAPLTFSTLMRWGNYDTVSNGTNWNSTEAAPAAVPYVSTNFSPSYFSTLSHTLPASFYYSSVPSWWPAGKAWPPVGPDVASGNVGICSGGTYAGAQAVSASQCVGGTLVSAWASHSASIPALDCYSNVMHGPADGSGSVLPFDANNCYTSGGGGGDTTPPTVSVTSPISGATVSGTATISANASDNVGVTNVTFYLDGSPIGQDATSPYTLSWSTTSAANGSHTLTAKASDAAGNVGTSVTVTVNNAAGGDATPPSVPANLSAGSATSSSQVYLYWTPSTDNVGVAGYKVFRNGSQVGTTATNLYTDTGLTTNTTYTYTVSAYDAAGNNSAQSSAASATTQSGSTGGGGGGSGSWSYIQSASANSAADTNALTLPGSTQAGDTVIVQVDWTGGNAFSSIADSQGNSWAEIGSEQNAGSVGVRSRLYYAKVRGGTDTITTALGGSAPSYHDLFLSEYSGIASLDGFSVNQNSGTTFTSNSFTTTQAGDLLYGAEVDSGCGGAASGWTVRQSLDCGPIADELASSIGSYAYTGTSSGGFVAWEAAFKTGTNTTSTPPDTTPPTVPTNLQGSVISASQINLMWTASTDSVGVSGYKVFRNGSQIATISTNSYSDTGLSASTNYSYTVSAYDAAGNTSAQSGSVNVTTKAVADTTPPATSITNPANGATVKGVVTVSATATDNVGITKVEFYVDGSLVSTGTAAPYAYSWNTATASNGSHTLTTKAYDAAGNVGTSANVSVTVSNAIQVPFKIVSVTVTATTTSATATIVMNVPASVRVQYGTSLSYGHTTAASPNLTIVYEHMTGLKGNTTYDFRILAIPQGATSTITSQNYTFKTVAGGGKHGR